MLKPNPVEDSEEEAAEEEKLEEERRRAQLGTSGLFLGPITGAEERYAALVEQAERNYGPER